MHIRAVMSSCAVATRQFQQLLGLNTRPGLKESSPVPGDLLTMQKSSIHQ